MILFPRGKFLFLQLSTCFVLWIQLCVTGYGIASESSNEKGPRVWNYLDNDQSKQEVREITALKHYRIVRLNGEVLTALLVQAPLEFTGAANGSVITLPMPDGNLEAFLFKESPIMEPGLAAQFPEIRTYSANGLNDPSTYARFGWSPAGFHAIILSTRGTAYIERLRKHDNFTYRTYWAHDSAKPSTAIHCMLGDLGLPARAHAGAPSSALTTGSTLRSYRVAIAATGEYTQFFGGTVTNAMNNGIVPMVNQLNAIWEREFTFRLVLIANESSIIYTNGATDPYTDGDVFAMMTENQSNVDAVIGPANYDIGHVVGRLGSGGVAYLGVACNISGFKARAASSYGNPNGNTWINDLVAHEFGHQFDADHSYNGTTGFCAPPNRAANAAWEPGSGTTIMSYSGSCGAENVQNFSDPYYHVGSYDQIVTFTNSGVGNLCPTQTATGNTPPTVNAGPDYTIPQSTPFTLTASASDPNGDSLTYTWEQFDLGTASPPNTDDGSRPIFRSFNLVSSPSRTFPKLANILSNTITLGESLPTTDRVMNFRVSVRDNRAGGGGTTNDLTQITVENGAGPFLVTQPNTAVNWNGGSSQNVTWNVANTNVPPVNTATVNILLSTDGGLNFPTVLASSTPNDGSQNITVPNINTTMARIKVAAVSNIYFDISNANFTISTSGCGTITLAPPTLPGGTVSSPYNQTITASGGNGPYTLAVTLGSLPAGLSLSAAGNLSGSPTNIGSSTFTITATDQDSCTGSSSYTINVTAAACLFCDDFEDGVVDPGWSYVKPGWSEDGDNLVGTPSGKKAIVTASPIFAGCSNCSVKADIQTSGGIGNKVWLLGWYVDKANTLELLMKEETDRWVLKYRFNGSVVVKAKFSQTIDPLTTYDVEVTFDGADFRLYVNGTLLITMPKASGSTPNGTVGFQVKRTTARIGFITVD